jgi:peptide/nickel transport system ATP-binding protein
MPEVCFDDVVKTFHGRDGHVLTAVDHFSFTLHSGDSVALVGESGSGKSTIARIATRLEQPSFGSVTLNGEKLATHATVPAWIQMIFQDPFSSLNPHYSIGYNVQRPLEVKEHLSPRIARDRARQVLDQVGLAPADMFLDKRVAQLSGGQRQRANIARALILSPTFLIADEPTSMLDVSVGLGILNLLLDLREQGMAFLFITHNLAAARYLTDQVLVMYRGSVVESGPIDRVINHPLHPYTQALVAATPEPGRPLSAVPSEGTVERELGWCPFAHRCAYRTDACRAPIAQRALDEGGWVKCTLYD